MAVCQPIEHGQVNQRTGALPGFAFQASDQEIRLFWYPCYLLAMYKVAAVIFPFLYGII